MFASHTFYCVALAQRLAVSALTMPIQHDRPKKVETISMVHYNVGPFIIVFVKRPIWRSLDHFAIFVYGESTIKTTSDN